MHKSFIQFCFLVAPDLSQVDLSGAKMGHCLRTLHAAHKSPVVSLHVTMYWILGGQADGTTALFIFGARARVVRVGSMRDA